ncbi:hypothetical protein FRC11_009316 [Ceratobasidium sp. 423]|nr:hypothetical protein FRC11_009316 [Ceratobasidium sp. 423]
MLASGELLQHVPLVSFLDAYPEPAFILCSSTLPHSSLEFLYGNHALHAILFGHDDTAVIDDQSFFSALTSDQDVGWLADPLGVRSPLTPHTSRSSVGDSRTIRIRPDWLPRDHTPLDLELTPTPIDIPGVYVFTASPRKAPMNLLRSETHTELQLRRDLGLRLSDFPPLPASAGTRIRSRKSKSESTSWLSQPAPPMGPADLPSRMIETFPWEKTSLGPKESWPVALKVMVKYLMEKPVASCIFWSWPDQVMLYNDTYAKMIGGKHPGSFGQKGKHVWGELWEMLAPVSEQCRRGRSTCKDDDQLFFNSLTELHLPEEVYHTWHWTPIWQEDGTVGGVWNGTLETTQKVIAERRLSGMSDLFARMSDAKTQEQFGERTLEVLSRNPLDLPFAALYWCEVKNAPADITPTKNKGPALASTYLRHRADAPIKVKFTLAGSVGIPNGHPIARQTIKYTLDPVTYRPVQMVSEPQSLDSPVTSDATPRIPFAGSPLGSTASTIQLPPTSPIKGLEIGIDLAQIFASGTIELINPLPTQLAQGLDGRGFKDVPRAAALLPINMCMSQSRERHNGRVLPYAVLLLGLNTRRPYDADYASWLESVGASLSNQLTVVLQREADMRLIEEQERIDKAKTLFFTNVSHELRTPLTLIQAPLEQLSSSENVSRDLHYRVQLALRNCKRLKKLIDSIMDMSKLEAGRLVGNFRPVQLGRITADLAALFRSMAEKKGIDYQISCDTADEPVVYVDTDLWEKIVYNLLSNAFKYTPRGRVSLSVTHDAGFSHLRVSDTGVGIPKEHLDAVFERFFRVNNNASANTAEGTGELVTLHGGYMYLSSQTEEQVPGHSGSTFTVTIPHGCAHLPVALIHEAASHDNGASHREREYWMELEHPTPSSNASTSDEGESATSSTLFFEKEDVILVVDDNADMRAYIRKIFAPYLTVVEAKNGPEALEVAISQKLNLILCDVMMPGMDGPELLRRLHINEQHRAEQARIALAEEREHVAASRAEDAEAQRQLEVEQLLIDVTSHELRQPVSAIIQNAEVVRTNMKGLRNLLHDCRKRNICFNPTDRMLAELEDDLQAMDSITQYVIFCLLIQINMLNIRRPQRCGLAQARIANDVLSLSRIQLNVLSVIPTEFDIKQETNQILMVFRNELISKDIGFSLDLGRGADIYGLHTISTDRSRYAQIITNLMSNAIRFTDMSTGLREIKVALELSLDPPLDESCAPPPPHGGRPLPNGSSEFESGDMPIFIYVSVKDSGPGLHKEDLALLFQRFQQGSNAHHVFGGSGLGLFVCRQICNLMGGKIEVVSNLGEGAMFRFFIKATAASGRNPRPPRPIGLRAKRSTSVHSKGSGVSRSSVRSGHRPLPETPNLQNNRPLHVLITEDNKINQTVLARQMKRAGFTYALASNGLEAIRAIGKADSQVEASNDPDSQKFDVVLMDLEMPVLDGFAATREIRRREATGNLKTRSFIIALTGNARLEQVQSARDAGVDDVIIKPYQIDALISKMRTGYQLRTDTD